MTAFYFKELRITLLVVFAVSILVPIDCSVPVDGSGNTKNVKVERLNLPDKVIGNPSRTRTDVRTAYREGAKGYRKKDGFVVGYPNANWPIKRPVPTVRHGQNKHVRPTTAVPRRQIFTTSRVNIRKTTEGAIQRPTKKTPKTEAPPYPIWPKPVRPKLSQRPIGVKVNPPRNKYSVNRRIA